MTLDERLSMLTAKLRASYQRSPGWLAIEDAITLAEMLAETRAELATLRAQVDTLGALAVTGQVRMALSALLAQKPEEPPK